MNKLISYTAQHLLETFSAIVGMLVAVGCLLALGVYAPQLASFDWSLVLNVVPGGELVEQTMEWLALVPRGGVVGGGLLLSLLVCLLVDA
jgi:hypothetical protein